MHCSTLEHFVVTSNRNIESEIPNLRDTHSDEEFNFAQTLSSSDTPKGLNCLCCPKKANQKSLITQEICPLHKRDYALITEPPKRQQLSILDSSSPIEMRNQIIRLTQKLNEIESEKDELYQKLEGALQDKERCNMQMEVMISAHESRITEMHCVIAELKKKLVARNNAVIIEENDADYSDYSFQDTSQSTSETNAVNQNTGLQTEWTQIKIDTKCDTRVTPDKTQIKLQQEEILHLKARIAYLESQIASKEQTITDNGTCSEVHQNNTEFEKLSNSDEFEKNNLRLSSDIINNLAHSELFIKSSLASKLGCLSNSMAATEVSTQENFKPEFSISKMAERVKLRKTVEQLDMINLSQVNELHKDIDMLISEQSIPTTSSTNRILNDSITSKRQERELARLNRQVESMKNKNSGLFSTLEESKKHCEHLYLLCGKYESNATALQLALNCSDRAIEAYDVMLALLESKLAVLKENSVSAKESRRSVELVARHFLDRLESEKNDLENSLGPWHNSLLINNLKPFEPWTSEDDKRLRNHVSKLKGKRSAAQNTVVTFESPFYSKHDYSSSNIRNKSMENKNDLEVTILMQKNDFSETESDQADLKLREHVQMLDVSSSTMQEEKLAQVQSNSNKFEKENM